MKRHVYIIHSRVDDSVASVICRALEAGKVSCLRPQASELRSTEGATTKVIDNSDVVVLILSSAVNGSAQVKWEIERAAKADKEIIPFRIDNAPLSKYLEFYLGTTHWLDASTPSLDQHVAQLVKTVRYLLGLEKERPAKKAIAAMVFGVLSLIVGGITFGLLGVILGGLELKAIASGRSSTVGRKYALVGIICGLIGIVLAVGILWYTGFDPYGWMSS